MSQKSPDTQKPVEASINGSFTFKAEKPIDIYAIGELFLKWCEDTEKSQKVTLISNRVDYNHYPAIDRLSK